jgi:pilus assembly protein CpaC
VEITEINNTKASKLGIRWYDTIQVGEVLWEQAGRTPASLPEIPSIIKVGDLARYSALAAELRLLIDKGAAQVLSKPKIVTKSGTPAKFMAGGEFPVVSEGVGGGTIQWKQYGLRTDILPTVLPEGFIDIALTTEVSKLDWSNQVKGNPALVTRQATSHVRIKSGQTIALAGLVETTRDEKRAGVPLLCDIPVLGYLFSRKDTVETKSNILIFVTPRLIE